LTIIELAEPVTEVAASGRPPGRLSYEPVRTPSVQEMHFAINQEPSHAAAKVPSAQTVSEQPAPTHRIAISFTISARKFSSCVASSLSIASMP
jgi:hypothetical protein